MLQVAVAEAEAHKKIGTLLAWISLATAPLAARLTAYSANSI